MRQTKLDFFIQNTKPVKYENTNQTYNTNYDNILIDNNISTKSEEVDYNLDINDNQILKIKNTYNNNRVVYVNERESKVWVEFNFLSLKERKELFDHCLNNIPWTQHIMSVGRIQALPPRLSCSMNTAFEYGNSKHTRTEWDEKVKSINERVNNYLNTSYDACLLNLYRNGDDYIAPHADEQLDQNNSIIAGISLGQERTMILSDKEDPNYKIKFDLPSGSLFVMEGKTQVYFKHGIPKQPKQNKPRISLNFRNIAK